MKKALFIVLAVTLALQGTAFAKAVSGTVSSVDLVAKSVTIKGQDGAESTIKIGALTKGLPLADLKAGKEISIEATQDAVTGAWNAAEIKDAAASATSAASAAAPAAASQAK